VEKSNVLKLIVAIPIALFIIYFVIDVALSMFRRLDRFLGGGL